MEMDVCWKEYFRDDARYADLVTNDENFQCMEEDAYEVVTQYVKAEELIQVKDEYRKTNY